MLYAKAVDKEQWEEICSGLKWKEEKDEFKLWIGEKESERGVRVGVSGVCRSVL